MRTEEEIAEYKREWRRQNPDKVRANRLRERAKIAANRPTGPRICAYRECNNEIINRTWLAKYCCSAHEQKERYLRKFAEGYYKKWKDDNPEKVRESQLKYRSKPENEKKRKLYDNSAERVAERRRQHLARRYGITLEEYNALLTKQDGVCAVCSGPLTRAEGKAPHVDHDHITGKPRGILCAGCNHGLGYIEKPGWVELARAYLNRVS